jgi:hypothetical protein
MGVDFSVPINKTTLQRGSACFDESEGLSSDHALYAVSDELLRACVQFRCIDNIYLCRSAAKTGDFSYLRSDDLYYKDRFIATVIIASRDKTEFSAVSTYCDERLAENCVGIRLIHEGERNEDGTLKYTRIELLSGENLLDYYVWLLLLEDERDVAFRDLPEYDSEDGWEERIIFTPEGASGPVSGTVDGARQAGEAIADCPVNDAMHCVWPLSRRRGILFEMSVCSLPVPKL